MPRKTKEQLKDYFQTGDIPSQSEYAELIDALRHMDEKLPIADVESLQASLDSKATLSGLINHVNDNSLHNGSMSGADIKTAYEGEANTNAFTDTEKQQVADGVTHRADTNSHVSSVDKTKWNNQLSIYTVGEVLTPEMGNIFRIYNGGLYQYVGDFPIPGTFTTSDFMTEITEVPTRWQDVLSTFPPVEHAKLSPRSIAPNTTRHIQLDASNIKMGTTIDLGADITILSYQYLSNERMLVQIQSNGNYGDVFPKINNGKEMTMVEAFSISDGDVYVPGSVSTPWMMPHNDIQYSVGSWDAQITGGKYVGYFSEIPTDTDFVWSMRINATTDSASQMYFGFKTDPANTGPASAIEGVSLRLYTNNNTFTSPGSAIDWTPGAFFEVKRTKLNASTAKMEYFVDGVLEHTIPSTSVTGSWFPYFYTYTINHISEMELKII